MIKYARVEGLNPHDWEELTLLPDSESLHIPPEEQYHEPTT